MTTTIAITLTSQTEWTVPEDWSGINSFRCTGGGGGGGTADTAVGGGGGGGGGAWARSNNVAGLVPGQVVSLQVAGGAAADTDGEDTWIGGSSLATSFCGAEGGKAGAPNVGGVGGDSANCVGDESNSGGDGGGGVIAGGGHGGGSAANSNGSGSAGGVATDDGGAGGAASEYGESLNGYGQNSTSGDGGQGGPNSMGSTWFGGAGGTSGSVNGVDGDTGEGGGGGYSSGGATNGGDGGRGGDSTSSLSGTGDYWGGGGAGGGGLAINAVAGDGGAGGAYGGGGGGGGYSSPQSGGAGGIGNQGVIYITYEEAPPEELPGYNRQLVQRQPRGLGRRSQVGDFDPYPIPDPIDNDEVPVHDRPQRPAVRARLWRERLSTPPELPQPDPERIIDLELRTPRPPTTRRVWRERRAQPEGLPLPEAPDTDPEDVAAAIPQWFPRRPLPLRARRDPHVGRLDAPDDAEPTPDLQAIVSDAPKPTKRPRPPAQRRTCPNELVAESPAEPVDVAPNWQSAPPRPRVAIRRFRSRFTSPTGEPIPGAPISCPGTLTVKPFATVAIVGIKLSPSFGIEAPELLSTVQSSGPGTLTVRLKSC